MVSTVIPVQPFDLVIFGATGDLAHRKILPSLYRRLAVHQMPAGSRVIGAARSKMSQAPNSARWRSEALAEFVEPKLLTPPLVEEFLNGLDYVAIDATGEGGWSALAKKLDEKPKNIRAFYLSVAPQLFAPIADRLSQAGIATPESRIVVEKPLGHDLASAKALNVELAQAFRRGADLPDRPLPREGDGAEPDGDPLRQRAVRAARGTRTTSSRCRSPSPSRSGVEGRGAYYDKSGAMRDMVQNHMMQLLCLTAMEPPSKFDPDAVRDEKLKVIRALDPLKISDTVRGQYRANGKDGQLPRACRRPGEPHRELRRLPGAYRQLALVGDALLPAHRQEALGAAFGDLRHLQASAAHDLPAGRRAPGQRADHPAAAGRGHHAARGDQGPRPGRHAADRGAARHDLRARARAGRGRDARGLRAADHGRDPRQPDALHARRRGRGGLGMDRPDHQGLGGVRARGRCPTTRAAPGRSTSTS